MFSTIQKTTSKSSASNAIFFLAERFRRSSIGEYHRMGAWGILAEDERVELIDGGITKMSPISLSGRLDFR